MLASSIELRNLVAVIDNNDLQSLGRTSQTHPSLYPLEGKFRSFEWESVDGHDGAAIVDLVRSRAGNKPFLLVAKTIKGKGVSYMENTPIWHYRSPDEAENPHAVAELGG